MNNVIIIIFHRNKIFFFKDCVIYMWLKLEL